MYLQSCLSQTQPQTHSVFFDALACTFPTAYKINCQVEKNPYKQQTLHFVLTLKLPLMTKTEFLLTISIQYQEEKWWE